MRLGKLLAVSAGAVAASATLTSPRTVDRSVVTPNSAEPPFLIEVVANGVPADGKAYKPNRDLTGELIGLDLWIGADTAYHDLQKASDTPLVFKLVPNNDQDDIAAASKISESIQSEPRALAVIGHGITATTHASVDAYAQAGIPLMVALATADSAVRGESDKWRSRVAYRLSPSDSTVQAPAIAYFIRTHLPADLRDFDVHLFASTANGAEPYSRPLCEQTRDILKANGLAAKVTELDSNSFSDEVTEIQRHDPGDFIVYCGYAKDAVRLLQAVTQTSTKASSELPRFIVNSAVQEEDLTDIHGLSLFRMGPLDQHRCSDTAALKRLTDAAAKVQRPLTAEQIHGYDAVQVIAEAVSKCSSNLSRRCVLDVLETGQTLPSICSDYSFRDGENIISDFFVFPTNTTSEVKDDASSDCKTANVVTITPPEVLSMLRTREQSLALVRNGSNH